jgi:hypothetical protein
MTDDANDDLSPPPSASPAAHRDPREHWCHCGKWASWGLRDEWRCDEHRTEIGFDREGCWRMSQ